MKKIAVTAVTVALALTAGAALAHTSVAESDPVDGSTIEGLPAEVSVRFGNAELPAPQPAQLTEGTLVVLDACGVRVDNEDSEYDNTTSTISASTAATEKSGRYELHWFGTAADGAAQSGVIDFAVSGGSPCTTIVRSDAADDVDLGFNPTSVVAKPTASGAGVTVTLADAVACKSFKPDTGRVLSVEMDTNWDETIDYSGAFTCRMKKVVRDGVTRRIAVYGLTVTKGDDETPSSKLRVRKTGAKALMVVVPSSILEGSEAGTLDLYVSSTTESDECGDGTSCTDRAPDLGWVRPF